MKFVLATAVAVASLNLVLGSRQLRELSSCQQELRRLQCTASLPAADAFETSDQSATTTTTAAAENTTTSAATMAPSRRLALCRRRLSQCQANLPAAEPATAAPTVSFRTIVGGGHRCGGGGGSERLCMCVRAVCVCVCDEGKRG